MTRKRAGILIFNDVEVLDFCGPFEVFSVVRLDEARQTPPPFEVVLIAETMAPVTTAGGMQVLPAATFQTCPRLDLLLVPGGRGTRTEMHNANLIAFVQAQAAQVELVASVCTGALVLAKAGLLEGRRATTHWGALDQLRSLSPAITVDDAAQVVDAGSIMTSAGIAAGLDLALSIVQRTFGTAVAQATARHMEYPFRDPTAPRPGFQAPG